jgi:hypothetical protein
MCFLLLKKKIFSKKKKKGRERHGYENNKHMLSQKY